MKTELFCVLFLILIVNFFIATVYAKVEDDPNVIYERACSLHDQQKYEEAEKLCDKLIAEKPEYGSPYYLKGNLQWRKGMYKENVALWESFLKNVTKKSSSAWSNYGASLAELNMYEESLRAFKESEQIDPTNKKIYLNLIGYNCRTGHYDEALIAIDKLKKLGVISEYYGMVKLMVSLIYGKDVPPESFSPSSDYWDNVLSFRSPQESPHFLGNIDGKRMAPSYLSFAGTPDNPYLAAPNFMVWEGAVITTKTYGTLLINGTQFRYVVIHNPNKRTVMQGIIEKWKISPFFTKIEIKNSAGEWVEQKQPKFPLIIPTYDENINRIQSLLASGADVNAKDINGVTALWQAAANGHLDIVKVLLESGANVNIQHKSLGVTALWMAAREGHTEIVKLLLAAGADVKAGAKDTYTPLEIAKEKGHTEIIKLLKEYGAKD
jgi:tetratricopeptide (TPR) repeat protein